LKAKHIP